MHSPVVATVFIIKEHNNTYVILMNIPLVLKAIDTCTGTCIIIASSSPVYWSFFGGGGGRGGQGYWFIHTLEFLVTVDGIRM